MERFMEEPIAFDPARGIAEVLDRVEAYLKEHEKPLVVMSPKQVNDVWTLVRFLRSQDLKLVGDRVRFGHMLHDDVGYAVTFVHADGMLEIDGLPGKFAPHLFVRVHPKPPTSTSTERAIVIPPAGKALRQIEAEAARLTLELTGGNISRAAELLGVSRPTIAKYQRRKP